MPPYVNSSHLLLLATVWCLLTERCGDCAILTPLSGRPSVDLEAPVFQVCGAWYVGGVSEATLGAMMKVYLVRLQIAADKIRSPRDSNRVSLSTTTSLPLFGSPPPVCGDDQLVCRHRPAHRIDLLS